MSFFLILMVMGLTGMTFLALPGLFRTGHAGGHHLGHGGRLSGHTGQAVSVRASGHSPAHGNQAGPTPGKLAGIIPSPRTVFSLMALYGAFGYALLGTLHWTPLLAGLVAPIPAWLVEHYMATPLWNALFQFQAKPCSPLTELVFTEAEVVTPFANGRGIVRVVRDGRVVQFSARLPEEQAGMPVRVGDKLRVENVDAANERLMVSLH
jgi:hypothetical protein